MNSTRIERARHYLAKIPVAVSGQGGHSTAFKAVYAITVGFDLNEDEALAALSDWNAACEPPWSERELRHKIASARRYGHRPPGYLLGDQERAKTPKKVTPPAITLTENERKARQRNNWPIFERLTRAELEAIARLRNLPLDAVIGAYRQQFLAAATVDSHRCFIVHEGSFAQARRLDGGQLYTREGKPTKAKNLLGSQGAFLGRRWLGGPTVKVLMLEGAISLIEGLAAHEIVAPPDGWTVVAATAAGSRFYRDPELLSTLAGRIVRIVPDQDKEGLDGAATWLADLEEAGCEVDAHPLPSGVKDLGPLVAAPQSNMQNLKALFS